MSRVLDALRRAEQSGVTPQFEADVVEPRAATATASAAAPAPLAGGLQLGPDFLSRVAQAPFSPSPDSHLIDMAKPHEAPAEEFRTLRTRLNHLQTLQPIHTVVVTSPSPAEGKSFAA